MVNRRRLLHLNAIARTAGLRQIRFARPLAAAVQSFGKAGSLESSEPALPNFKPYCCRNPMQSARFKSVQGERRFEFSAIMKSCFLRSMPASLVTTIWLAIVFPLTVTGAYAQTDDKAKPPQQQPADPKAEPRKDPQRRDDLADVSKLI